MHPRGEKQPQLGVGKGGTIIASCTLSACQASSKAQLITEDLDKKDFCLKSDHEGEGINSVLALRNKFADDVKSLESKSSGRSITGLRRFKNSLSRKTTSQTYEGKVIIDPNMLTSTNGSFGRKVGTYPVCSTLTYMNDLVQPKLLGASSRNPTDAARAVPSHTKVVK